MTIYRLDIGYLHWNDGHFEHTFVAESTEQLKQEFQKWALDALLEKQGIEVTTLSVHNDGIDPDDQCEGYELLDKTKISDKEYFWKMIDSIKTALDISDWEYSEK